MKYQQIRRQQADPHFKLLNYQTPVSVDMPLSLSLSLSVSVAPLQTRNHVNNLLEEGKVKSTEKEIWGKREFEAHVWTRVFNIFVIVYVNR